MERFAYRPDAFFDGSGWISGPAIVIAGGWVEALLDESDLPSGIPVHSLPGTLLVPAFLDLQIYGAGGRLFSEFPEPQSLQLLYEHNLRGGTVLCQPTAATNTKERFFRCIDAVRAYWDAGGMGVHGLHLEGPWLNRAKKGAHIEELIVPPTEASVREVLEYGKGVVTMITVAPEMCPPGITELIRSYGVVVSAGHSNATYDEATAAFDGGIPVVTHLFNAMSPLQHRAPGLAGAALVHTAVRSSIIPDGHHVHFTAVRLAARLMGERLFAITDAVTETETGPYPHRKAGDKYESGGILSGSALSMHGALVNLVEKAGVSRTEALRMCSLYPAQVIGVDDRYGRIAPGYMAEFAALDSDLRFKGLLPHDRV
ncbi:MAG TPA: N-acetylglucosamine-6-phosphate deacetylase [Chitinophagaceae bacterium]|jgi:N-acetylglucosamine-6-phosphate deacetylase|nr:N-acetylglucosamine-6-phosphate deacetylase [Chitinophagaceae bacterium]